MKSFLEFKSNFIFESLINETMLYLSPDFRDTLKRIKLPISDDLLSLQSKDIKPDITFVDLGDEGMATFKTMKMAKKHISEEWPGSWFINAVDDPSGGDMTGTSDYIAQRSSYWNKSRNPIKIGRLVNTIFPGKYSQKEVEEFTNKFKSLQTSERIYVVEGDDIYFWYKSENYYESKGSLGNSCMKGGLEPWFKIYTQNPGICKMLIVTDEDEEGVEKLKGRALIWEVKNVVKSGMDFTEFDTFLDRQYAISDSIVTKMRSFAEDRNWAIKTNNNHHFFSGVTFKGEDYKLSMEVNLEKWNFSNFPYVDTFRRLDPETGILYNDNDDDLGGYYILNSDSGRYEDLSRSTVWSEWHDMDIEEDEAVFSDGVNSYIYRNQAVEVTSGSSINRGYYPEDYDELVFDGWNEETIHIDDSTWSEYYGYNILSEESISVVEWIGDDFEINQECWINNGDGIYVGFYELSELDWFKTFNKITLADEYHSGILEELLYKDESGEWALKAFSVEVYKSEVGVKGLKWLSEFDVMAFGVDIDRGESKLVNIFDYYKNLSIRGLFDILIKRLNMLIDSPQLEIWYTSNPNETKIESWIKRLNKVKSPF